MEPTLMVTNYMLPTNFQNITTKKVNRRGFFALILGVFAFFSFSNFGSLTSLFDSKPTIKNDNAPRGYGL